MDANEVHEMIEQAWEEYSAQPVNFGSEPDPIAEHDAFYAGALAMISMKIPF